jgi:hypothetical protein
MRAATYSAFKAMMSRWSLSSFWSAILKSAARLIHPINDNAAILKSALQVALRSALERCWPIRIQRPRLFWFSALLLIAGFIILLTPAKVAAALAFLGDHNDVFTAFAAVAIACFTLTLWRSTEKMWKVTSDGISLLERPQIVIRNPDIIPSSDDEQKVRIFVYNCGRMPARVIEVGAKFFDTDQLPTVPDRARADMLYPHMTVIPLAALDAGKAITVLGTFKCSRQAKTVWLWLKYSWIFCTYEQSFACELVQRADMQPQPRGGKAYNYDIKCGD